jgi:hypothetical protein
MKKKEKNEKVKNWFEKKTYIYIINLKLVVEEVPKKVFFCTYIEKGGGNTNLKWNQRG